MNTMIEITCPRCGHIWYEDVDKLKLKEEVIYKALDGAPDVPGMQRFRVFCPVDRTRVIVTVEERKSDE